MRVRLRNFDRETLDAACVAAAVPVSLVSKKPIDEAIVHSGTTVAWAGMLMSGPGWVRWTLIVGGFGVILATMAWSYYRNAQQMRGDA